MLPLFSSAKEDVELGMGVGPQVFDLAVWPGEKIKNIIKLTNRSNVPLPIEAKVTSFTAEENTGEMLLGELPVDESIAAQTWFEIKDPDFILEPGEAKIINFEIKVPDDAERGGHYAVMLFEPRLPSFYFEENQIENIPVIGTLFLLSVKTLGLEPETEEKLEIVEFSLPEEERLTILERVASGLTATVAQAADFSVTERSPSGFVLKIKNNDIYHIKPSGKILIYDIWGRTVSEFKVPKKTILPGKTRSFPVSFDPKPLRNMEWLPASVADFLRSFLLGRYEARLQLQVDTPLKAEKTQPDVYDKLAFFSLPWKLLLGLMFFVVLIIKYRSRVETSFRILIKGNRY